MFTAFSCSGFPFGDGPARGARAAEPDFGAWFWGGPGRRRGGRMGGGRMFEQGDLKLVILRLLDEKPRHGYDIIKALEERSGGAYSPSPGTVYPTLTLLEDLGYARASVEEGGRKVYEITAEGRAYLAEQRPAVDDIFNRLADMMGSGAWRAGMGDLANAFKNVGRAAFAQATHHRHDPDRLARIREVLERAAREIDALQ